MTVDGWRLDIRQYRDPEHFDPGLLPIVIIPGYSMNTFILQFHPSGRSMVEYLTQRGFEVFTANLRGQGGSMRIRGDRAIGFRQLALIDYELAESTALAESSTEHDAVAAIGCSLGGSVLYGHLAHHVDDHDIAALVSVGAPLRWERVHPLLEIAFRSPTLAGSLPIMGTRAMARAALPFVQKMPFLLQLYMNTEQIDLSRADELVKTVEDPNPHLNRQIAHWIRERDLMVDDVNVTRAMRHIDDLPLLCILANRDGIVPPEAALSITDYLGTDDIEVLVAGDERHWFAHADLFISHGAEDVVFSPLADWLSERSHR